MPKLTDQNDQEELEELRAFYALLKDVRFVETGDKHFPVWVGEHSLTHNEYTSLHRVKVALDEIYS